MSSDNLFTPRFWTVSIQHFAQAATAWPDATVTDRNAGAHLTETIERIRWRLWHGQVKRALDLIAETAVTVAVAADDKSPIAAAARKVARLLGGLHMFRDNRISSSTTRQPADTKNRFPRQSPRARCNGCCFGE